MRLCGASVGVCLWWCCVAGEGGGGGYCGVLCFLCLFFERTGEGDGSVCPTAVKAFQGRSSACGVGVPFSGALGANLCGVGAGVRCVAVAVTF